MKRFLEDGTYSKHAVLIFPSRKKEEISKDKRYLRGRESFKPFPLGWVLCSQNDSNTKWKKIPNIWQIPCRY